jgi:hypothetical protein
MRCAIYVQQTSHLGYIIAAHKNNSQANFFLYKSSKTPYFYPFIHQQVDPPISVIAALLLISNKKLLVSARRLFIFTQGRTV